LARAQKLIQSGDLERARHLIKTTSDYCIACHTRTNNLKISIDPSKLKGVSLSASERAELYAALRDFDKAYLEYETLIKDEKFGKENEILWVRAVQKAVVHTVRAMEDAEKSLNIVNLALASPSVPLYFKDDLLEWKRSIEEWNKEGSKEFKNDDAYMKQGRSLIGKASQYQKWPFDNAANIYYLRASSLFHKMFLNFPKSDLTTEAYLLAGMSYEAMLGIDEWALHEIYYETCIRKSPHSELSLRCYKRLQESIFYWLQDSDNKSVPTETSNYLAPLKALALPQ